MTTVNILSWTAATDEYFDLYNMTDEKRVHAAQMKRTYRTKYGSGGRVALQQAMRQQSSVHWEEMKLKQTDICLLVAYQDKLFEQLHLCSKGKTYYK